jgi:hypothetical protein
MPSSDSVDVDDWEGAIGPQSEEEPMFYELDLDTDSVRLVGASPGMEFEYSVEQFESLVDDGEWILATDDREKEVYLTPAGEIPY